MTSPERVAVIGTGLVGTSIAMAALRVGSDVVGFDTDPDALAESVALAGFKASADLGGAVEAATLVFVCTPLATIPELVGEALAASRQATVTDAGSVKSRVMAEVQTSTVVEPRLLARFVGGHPMGGSERSGPGAASASLLDGIVWALTPSSQSDPTRVERLEAWISSVGAHPVRMTLSQHDRAVAIVSHLPQVVSSTLMTFAAREEAGEEDVLRLAAGGFRDLTRLAASNPALWAGIMQENREELARAIDLYIADLEKVRALLRNGDGDGDSQDAGSLETVLDDAKKARLELAAKPQVKAGVAVLQIPVPDRPGVLADLTSAMGEKGVNIEDLQIVHSLEGGRGTVHLTVAGSEAEAAASALLVYGFDSVRLA